VSTHTIRRMRAPTTPRRDTRATLIRVAGELLEERGIDAVTLRAVGERAGVSRTAPYRHFADKEGLLAAVATTDLARLGDAMARAGEGARDPRACVEAMGTAYVRFGLAEPARYRLLFGAELRGREHPDVEEAALSRTFTPFALAVADAQAAGALPGEDSAALTAALWAAAHGAVELTLAGHMTPAKGLSDPVALIRLLLHHLRADGTVDGSAPRSGR